MKELIETITKTDIFKELTQKLKGQNEIWLSNLCGSAFSCVVAGLRESTDKPFLILLQEEEIEEMQEDFGALGIKEIFVFPQREMLKGEKLPSYSEVFSRRITTLSRLPPRPYICFRRKRRDKRGGHYNLAETQSKLCHYIIISSPQAVSEKLPSPALFKKQIRKIKLGDSVDREEIVHHLTSGGYSRSDQVMLKGEFSVRGGIIDVFVPSSDEPFRLELLGDEIVSMRKFDVQTQTSVKNVREITVLPAAEINLDQSSNLLDYIPKDTLVFVREPFSADEELSDKLKKWALVHSSPSELPVEFNPVNFNTTPLTLTSISTASRSENRVSLLIERIRYLRDLKFTVLILAEYQGQAERMVELLKEYNLYAKISVLDLAHGWIDANHRTGIIVLKELFAVSKVRRHKKFSGWTKPLKSVESLKPGDYVVHINYGIGIFQGTSRIPEEESHQDFFLIEYADGDKLYIPLDQLNMVQKYIGRMDPPPQLNRLGTAHWQGTKGRVRKSIELYAKELLDIYAWRKSFKGYTFSKDTHWQQEFELGFPYEETPDQIRTAVEVKEDMEKDIPMDRLLCGDVGYGKTEVAMRSAFKSVMDEKQIAVLVPTTILAEQHFQTFIERMAPFPIRIEVLSRFKSDEEQRKIIKDLGEGKVDIVIGTHRLIQKDIKFHDLGLLIIDEEQRFGVLQKEYIKKLKKEVDVLTLSATPIPRTLYMGMSGIRDISIIETPPLDRLSIKTFVMEFTPKVIRTAILREMERGGQVFYVHNRIEILQTHAHHLKNLIPEARIAMAHGQMEEGILEKIMFKFLSGEIDVLVSTDIIGAGLDIANANTIIITDAQDFGLSQLYQLRGRVGRAGHQAYAYIFYNPELVLTEQARKRLQAISEFVQLGSGLKLALRDLEIRGAGNILGKDQHGHIQRVGLDLYCKMLEEAVAELKGNPLPAEVEPALHLKINACIPDDYVGSMEQKTMLYKRMIGISNVGEIKKLEEELRDRYGELPTPVKKLMGLLEIRVLAKNAGVSLIEMKGNDAIISYNSRTIKVELKNPEKIFTQIKRKILEI